MKEFAKINCNIEEFDCKFKKVVGIYKAIGDKIMFDIPVVLFIFKRQKAVEVLNQIAKVRPKKLYILADGPRNESEVEAVDECRRKVEEAITWDCKVMKNYSAKNRGVYENIGKGAMWVFEHEENAIFLEDDNLPELTFFRFCEEMLVKYRDENKILWICGTNYLGKFEADNNESYVFTQHMLPCGWASWSNKFLKYYDGNMETYDQDVLKTIKERYISNALFNNMRDGWTSEYIRILNNEKLNSWDYQMDYSIKYFNLFGICPVNNQIMNIGIDEYSIHGGSSKKMEMTNRFCEIQTYPIDFPLIHPKVISINYNFEKKIGRIMTLPFNMRIKGSILKVIRKLFNIPYNIKTKEYFKKWIKK